MRSYYERQSLLKLVVHVLCFDNCHVSDIYNIHTSVMKTKTLCASMIYWSIGTQVEAGRF